MAVGIGALIPIQTGANATLRTVFGHSAYAAIFNFAIGGVCILLISLAGRIPMPTAETMATAPWWSFLGGLVGMVYVLTVSVVARKLGATPLLFLVLAGQVISSLVFDHFGLIGFPKSPLTFSKLFGIGLVILGVLAIRR